MNPVLKGLMVYFQTVQCPFCRQFKDTVLPPYKYNDIIDIMEIEVKPRYMEYYERYDISQMVFENPWIHDYVIAGRRTPDRKPSVPAVCIMSPGEKQRLYNEDWRPPVGRYIFSGITESQKQELQMQARRNPQRLIQRYTSPMHRRRYDEAKLLDIAISEYVRSQAQRLFFNKVRREIARVSPQNRKASINTGRYIHV